MKGQLILVWWFTKRDSQNPHQPGLFAYESERNSTHPGPLSSRVWRPGEQHDAVDVQPNLQIWLQLLRITSLGSASPHGQAMPLPQVFVLQPVIELGIKDASSPHCAAMHRALVDICYQEKRRRR